MGTLAQPGPHGGAGRDPAVERILRRAARGLARAWPRGGRWLEQAAGFAGEVSRKAAVDDLGTRAAALTYTAFLALFPLLLLALSVSGFVLKGRGSRWIDDAIGAIPGLGDLVARQASALVEGRYATGLVGLVGTTWAASALSDRARRTLGVIFGRRESYVRHRAAALLSTLVLGAAVLVTTGLSGTIVALAGRGLGGAALALVGHAVVFAWALGLVLLSYRVLIPGRIPWRELLPGALATAAGWAVLQFAGSTLVDRAIGRWSIVYGTIATVFGVLLFLRLTIWVFLSGAELSAILRDHRAQDA